MENQASRRALWSWALYDWANNGFFTLIQTFVFAAYFTKAVAVDEIQGTAQWGQMLGLAGLVIGLGGPVLGAAADACGRRKPWIAAFTLLTVAATALLWFIRPDPAHVLPGLVLAGLGTIGAEYAMIFYNAMLPDLVRPERLGRWSGWGWGLGYAGGLLVLVTALYGFVNQGAVFGSLLGLDRGVMEHVRAVCLLSAGWYLLFSLPLFMATPDVRSTGCRLLPAVGQALGQLRDSLRQAKKLRHLGLFLLARMIYNDGLTTMFAFGGIYAAGTFGLSTAEVIVFGIGLNVTAGLGAFVFAWVDDKVGSRRTILVSLAGLVVPGAAILLTSSETVFWVCGMALGIFVGPVQASSRTWLARVAPQEVRARMFGLFALSGKVTSFAGPLLVGWTTLAFASQRAGMSVVLALFLVGGALMLFVPSAAVVRAGLDSNHGQDGNDGP